MYFEGLHSDIIQILRNGWSLSESLEERLKGISRTEQVDLNRLRRQVSFDRLLARLFRDDAAPWVLKGGYSLPRSSQNSRVNDLVDLALLISDGRLDRARVANALQLTFARRGTHSLPASLSTPLGDSQTSFRALAQECGLDPDVTAVFENVRAFFENVLTNQVKH